MRHATLLAPFALASLLPTAALAQGGDGGFDVPDSIYGLQETVEITVQNTDAFSLFRGCDDITDSAPIVGETLLEDGSVRYEIDLSGVELAAGESLRVQQAGSNLAGAVMREATIGVENNVEIDVFASSSEWTAGPTVQVTYREMNVDSSLFAVFYFGTDVTAFVPMTAAETIEMTENPDDPFAPILRIDQLHLDFSILGGVIPPDGAIELVAFGSQADASFAYDVLPIDGEFVVIEEEEDCVKDAINKFLKDIGLEKDGDCTKATKTPAQIEAAADELADTLDDCTPRMSRKQQKCTYKDSSGDDVEVIIDFDSTGDSKASGKADAVIAVSGSNGGDASATNKSKCGAAIAVGADGRGATSNPGDGGNATATSNGGQSTAIAGDGGAAAPATNAGGNGGTSKATSSGPGGGSGTNTGTNGASGNPGTHGGGGFTQINAPGGSGTNGSSPSGNN